MRHERILKILCICALSGAGGDVVFAAFCQSGQGRQPRQAQRQGHRQPWPWPQPSIVAASSMSSGGAQSYYASTSRTRTTTSSPHAYSSSYSGGNSNNNNGDNGYNTNYRVNHIQNNEYDAIVLFPNSEMPFYLQETDSGEAAFAGYMKWDAPCSTIRNMGDVIVAIDGVPTKGTSFIQVIRYIQEKAHKNSHSFFTFRTETPLPPAYNSAQQQDGHGGSGNNNGSDESGPNDQGILPGDGRRAVLFREIDQIEADVKRKIQEVEVLQACKQDKTIELQEIHRQDLEWIELKRGALQKHEEEHRAKAAAVAQKGAAATAKKPAAASASATTTARGTAKGGKNNNNNRNNSNKGPTRS